MNKNELITLLDKSLKIAKNERLKIKNDKSLFNAKEELKKYQIKRLKDTHAEFLLSSDTNKAANFFLNELYGSKDLSQRDKDLEKLVPMMEKLFPTNALEVLTNAMVLDALTETLDNKMAETLGMEFSDDDYINAYKNLTPKEDRLKQIELIESLGNSLCNLVNLPFLASTLKMMAIPARIANLQDMHKFLNEGFYTFKDTKNPKLFIKKLVEKERFLLEEIYNSPTNKLSLNKIT